MSFLRFKKKKLRTQLDKISRQRMFTAELKKMGIQLFPEVEVLAEKICADMRVNENLPKVIKDYGNTITKYESPTKNLRIVTFRNGKKAELYIIGKVVSIREIKN